MICDTLAARKSKIPPRALSETTCIESLFETNTLSYPFTLSAIAPHSKGKYNLTLTHPNKLSQSTLRLSTSSYPSEFQLENGRLFNTLGECLLSKTYVGANEYALLQIHCAYSFPTIYSTREYNPDNMQWTAYETCPYGRTGPSVLELKAHVKEMPDGECRITRQLRKTREAANCDLIVKVYQIEEGEYIEWDSLGTRTGFNITLAIVDVKSHW